MNELLSIALRSGRDLVLPRCCAACSEAIPAELSGRLCPACHEEIDAISYDAAVVCGRCARPAPSGRCEGCERQSFFAAAAAYGPFEGALRECVHALKFNGDSALGAELGRRLAFVARTRLPEADVVVPVPLHASRLLVRGYNQSALLAREVARGLGLPLDLEGLQRHLATAEQSGAGRSARAENVRGAFKVIDRRFATRRVILVDDVLTTGATAQECASTLESGGAEHVYVLALAVAENAR